MNEGATDRDEERKRLETVAAAADTSLRKAIAKRKRLVSNIRGDLERHGNADTWKRFGDLLLAQTETARRDGTVVHVTDLFEEAQPQITIEIEENETVPEAAQRYFRRYAKARNALARADDRLAEIEEEIAGLERERQTVADALEAEDLEKLQALAGVPQKKAEKARAKKKAPPVTGVRIFTSSDGFEILVGRKARDNDYLTFRLARSLDTWLHAADYPGSHVVIRNAAKREIPPRTLIEAAQLAAFYSQGKSQVKAAVNYTQKKFVNKRKGFAPGLVSLAKFKTILVEPKIEGPKPRD